MIQWDGYRFAVIDDGLMDGLTGFSIDCRDTFFSKQIVVDALYD
ncbi:hypothetical protein [Bacilliculturomica massiliensis]|nr:hypothetical protein [Bacilliculturomica massiliensis]